MDFTPAEIEQILRDHWMGSEQFGGFQNNLQAQNSRTDLEENLPAGQLAGWEIIGNLSWCGYNDSDEAWLLVNPSQPGLWQFNVGGACGASWGDDISEIQQINIKDWIEEVANYERHNANMMG